jgi:DNA polymerase I
VAALKSARDQDIAVHPGQDIEYVVVDDAKTSRERVSLAHEEVETYDPDTTRRISSEPSKTFSHR